MSVAWRLCWRMNGLLVLWRAGYWLWAILKLNGVLRFSGFSRDAVFLLH